MSAGLDGFIRVLATPPFLPSQSTDPRSDGVTSAAQFFGSDLMQKGQVRAMRRQNNRGGVCRVVAYGGGDAWMGGCMSGSKVVMVSHVKAIPYVWTMR